MNTVSGNPFKKLSNRFRKSFLHLVGTGLTDGPYLIVMILFLFAIKSLHLTSNQDFCQLLFP